MANRKITFEEFWKKYPLHKAKEPAERAWNRLSARDRHAAFNGIEAYRESCMRSGASIKYAGGWLNDRRWEDEADEPVKTVARLPEKEKPKSMDSW